MGQTAFKLLSGHIAPALQVPPGKPTRQCKDTGSIANMGQTIQTAPILSQSRQCCSKAPSEGQMSRRICAQDPVSLLTAIAW
jgi:hypothetical protein